jgi:hypothetical protein
VVYTGPPNQGEETVRKKPINWDYFKERLEDASPLKHAVPVVCDGHVVELAVPVGGKRLVGMWRWPLSAGAVTPCAS